MSSKPPAVLITLLSVLSKSFWKCGAQSWRQDSSWAFTSTEVSRVITSDTPPTTFWNDICLSQLHHVVGTQLSSRSLVVCMYLMSKNRTSLYFQFSFCSDAILQNVSFPSSSSFWVITNFVTASAAASLSKLLKENADQNWVYNTSGLPQLQKPSQFHTKPLLTSQTGEQLALKFFLKAVVVGNDL